jgi:hypothetical protein
MRMVFTDSAGLRGARRSFAHQEEEFGARTRGESKVNAGPKAKNLAEKIAATAATEKLDGAYSDKIVEAVLNTITDSSVDPKTKVAVIRVGEICDALTTIVAGFLATSKDADNTEQLRKRCRMYADKLYRRARLAQEHSPVFAGYHPKGTH